MRVGFNYPWSYHRFGIDLGPNVEVDSTRWVRERSLAAHGKAGAIPLAPLNLFTHLERNLVNLKHLGIDIVRYWILCNGFNYYGSGPIKRNTPSPIPLLRFYDWRFTPPFETDQRFTYQFGLLLEKFQQHDMQIIPSLISFEFAGNPPVPPDAKGLAGGGHANCITDRNARLIFLSTMLNDLLVVSQKFKKTIFAWEVANEPYWNISPFGPLSQSPPTYALPGTDPVLTGIAKRVPEVNYEQMAEFLQEAIQLIESKGFASTVGHRFYSDIDPKEQVRFPTGSMPQFHYYAKPYMSFGDPYEISEDLFKADPAPFVGEFDSALNRFGQPWRLKDPDTPDTTLNRLVHLRDQGCELALLWPDLGPPENPKKSPGDNEEFAKEREHIGKNDPLKMTQPTRQAIASFTGGRLPPANE